MLVGDKSRDQFTTMIKIQWQDTNYVYALLTMLIETVVDKIYEMKSIKCLRT